MLAGFSLGAVHTESRAGRMASTNQVATEGSGFQVNIINYASPQLAATSEYDLRPLSGGMDASEGRVSKAYF